MGEKWLLQKATARDMQFTSTSGSKGKCAKSVRDAGHKRKHQNKPPRKAKKQDTEIGVL